jgi:hypothetical protein
LKQIQARSFGLLEIKFERAKVGRQNGLRMQVIVNFENPIVKEPSCDAAFRAERCTTRILANCAATFCRVAGSFLATKESHRLNGLKQLAARLELQIPDDVVSGS